MIDLKHLLESNRNWSENLREKSPDFFLQLARQQNPEYLWIGCSDSRVAANTIVDIPPGEIFVHRNIANLVIHTDLNCLSVIQFAVEVLGIKHIIVCGHYGCGGIEAALDNKQHGLIDNWLRHIQDTAHLYDDVLTNIPEGEQRADKLCEINVIEQVLNVSKTTIVQDAWNNGRELTIHGWIYSLKNGIISDLDIALKEKIRSKDLRKRFLSGDKRSA